MEELLKEIQQGVKEYKNNTYNHDLNKGKGSKSYITKRIDLLREKLLELKKSL